MTGARLVVVLGMHRSGTSAITRALQVLHVDLGNRLMPPNEQINARGFWEDLDIYDLNVEMLHVLDTEWYQAAPISEADVQVLRAKGFVLKAVELLRRKMRGVEVFGFKDPRLGRLLPFWREVFRHDAIDVRYVLALRNPMSVAASLRKRDGFEPTFSYLLWWVHTLGSVAGSSGSPRIVVDFDQLMHDPRAQLSRIASLLELAVDPQAMDSYASDFLTDDLRHSTFRVDDLRVDPQCPAALSDYFAQLARATTDDAALESELLTAQTEQGCAALQAMAPALQAMNRLQAEAIALRASAREHQARATQLDEVLKARDGQLAEMTGSLERSAAHAAGLEQEMAVRDQRIAESGGLLAQRDATISELQQDLVVKNDQLGQLQQQVGTTEGRIAEITAEGAAKGALVSELQGNLAAQTEALAQSQQQLAEQSSRAAALDQELAQSAHRTQELQERLCAAEARLAELTDEGAAQAALVSELQGSLAAQTEALAQSQQQLAEQSSRAAALEQQLAGSGHQIQEVHERLGAADARLAELAAENATQAALVSELQGSLAAQSEALAQRARQIEQQASLAAELDLALTEKDQLLAQSQAHAAQKQAELEQVRRELQLRTSLVLDLEALSAQQAAALVERERIEAELREAFDEQRASWNEFRRAAESEQNAAVQALQEAHLRISELAQRADVVERENREIRASWLWRVTHLAAPRRAVPQQGGSRQRALPGPKP